MHLRRWIEHLHNGITPHRRDIISFLQLICKRESVSLHGYSQLSYYDLHRVELSALHGVLFSLYQN